MLQVNLHDAAYSRDELTFNILKAFLDPYFSSGIHLAIAGGVTAVASICAVQKGECTESEAYIWHTARTEAAYTRLISHPSSAPRLSCICQRFSLVVLSAYQQIRAQSAPVLAKEDEDNFDRAFIFFRPIISGNTDVGRKFAGDDLNKTILFLAEHAFEPSQPEERAALISQYGDPSKNLPGALTDDDEETTRAKSILKGVAIRKLMRTEDIVHLDNFVSDSLLGFRLRLKKGDIGLDKVGENSAE